MSDRPYKSSRRGGERPPRDEYDRRERQGGGGGGGRERDRYRDRERERERERDPRGDRHERARDREEEPRDRDQRRYRSRSPRDRRERERDRDYHDRRDDRDRTRGKGRDDGREKPVRGGEEPQEKERNRGRDQDHGREDRNGDIDAKKGTWPSPSPSSAEMKGDGRKPAACLEGGLLTLAFVLEKHGNAKDQGPRRSASPRIASSPPHRSTSPRGRFEDEDYQGLPTRSKQDKHDRPGAPLSFKVKSQEREDDGGRDSRSKTGFEEGTGSFDADPMEEDKADEVEVEADDNMMAMMGFGGFGTTKDSKVHGNNAGGVRKEKKTEYRQYMNRVGGFNRPLSPSHN